MPRLLNRPPSYRLHKPSGQARVRIDGRDFRLGPFGSAASRREYDRIIGEWLANGRRLPTATEHPQKSTESSQPGIPAHIASSSELTVSELILSYWRHVEGYYVKDGRPTSEQGNIRQALRFIRKLYGHTLALDFSPLALKAVRQAMIEAGRCRKLINKDVNRIRGMFRWAAENELVPIGVHQALTTVAGLREGRSEAREKHPVGPGADEHVEAVLPFLTPTVAAMVQVQRLTGMRPGEVVLMRAVDIDMGDPSCWVYRPARHKGQHHGRERVVHLGPRAQAILRPFLTLDLTAYLFSPRRSVEQYRAEVRAQRKSPLTPSQAARQPKPNPKRTHGELYDDGAYRKAIRKACRKAGVPIWFPHQLRHSAATAIRTRYGLEASQVVLGHAELGTTQVYAERDLAKAREVMREIG